MPSSEISSTFRVLVFCKIAVISVAVADFLDFVALLTQNDKFLFRSFWRTLRLIEARKSLAVVLDTARREPLETLIRHRQKIQVLGKSVNLRDLVKKLSLYTLGIYLVIDKYQRGFEKVFS